MNFVLADSLGLDERKVVMGKMAPLFTGGEVVRIRTREEILLTLDANSSLDGCLFAGQMLDWCNTTQRVLKVVRCVFDECEYRMYETKYPFYILDGLICDGCVSEFEHVCDHGCQLLWHEEWLEEGSENYVFETDESIQCGIDEKTENTPTESILAPRSCQLKAIDEIKNRNSWFENIMQYRITILWSVKINFIYTLNSLSRLFAANQNKYGENLPSDGDIRPGDAVRVLGKNELKTILDAGNKYKGCQFVPEMFQFCDKEFVVLKTVKYFFDERQKRMCRCNDIYLLSGVMCSGRRRAFSIPCDRSCFYFWHKHWLRKIHGTNIYVI